MALTLQAHITWVDNLADFKTRVAQGTDILVAHTATVDRLVRSLSGTGLLGAANNTAAAIEQMGGVTKLTSAEIDRTNTLMEKAIAKYTALGQTAPQAIRDLAAATTRASETTVAATIATETWGSALQRVAGMFGLVFAGGVFVQFGRALLETGERAEVAAANLGMTVEQVQRLQYVTEQSGLSFETIVTAVEGLQKRLGTGNDGAVGAMQQLGFNTAEFLKLNTYEQIQQLAGAVGAIGDPVQRAAAEFELFGRSGQKTGAVMLSNFQALAAAAPVMSDDAVRALATADRGFKALGDQIKAWTGSVLDLFSHTFDGVVLLFYPMIAKLEDGMVAVMRAIEKIPGADKVFPDLKAAIDAVTDSSKWFRDAAAAQGRQLDALATKTEHTGGTVVDFTKKNREAVPAIDAHEQALQALIARYAGWDLADKVTDLSDAMTEMAADGLLSTKTLWSVAQAASQLRQQGAELTPQLAAVADGFDQMVATSKALAAMGPSIKNIPVAAGFEDNTWATRVTLTGRAIGDMTAQLVDAGAVADVAAKKFNSTRAVTNNWTAALKMVSSELTKLGQIAGGTLGALISNVGQMVVQFEAADKMTQQLGKSGKELGGNFGAASVMFNDDATASEKWGAAIVGATAIASGAMAAYTSGTKAASTGSALLHGAMSGAEAGAAFGPWGAAIGAAGGALLGFIGHLNAGRKAVEDFAQSFGGFDDLHAKLLTLGAAGEQLWVNLTQGVGKSDPAAAKAAIDAITAALDKQKASADALTQSQNQEIGTLLGQLQGLGAGSLLQPYLDKLSKAKGLTDDNLAAIKALAGDTTVSFDQMQKAAQALGISTDSLGHSFQVAKAQADWQSVIDNLDTLTRGGAAMNDLLGDKGLQKKISELVQQSIKFGTDIPGNMKPWIQGLIDTGGLLDANGNKITDTSKLKFGGDLLTSIQGLIDKIGILIDKLSTGVPDAITKIPKTITTEVKFHGSKTGDWPSTDSTSTDPTGAAAQSDSASTTTFHSGTARVLPFPFSSAIVAHSGLLPDEVPAILQTGESVLNRRATAALGPHAIGALNRGARPSDSGAATVAELRALRDEMRQQRAHQDADRRFLETTLPTAIEAALRKGAA